MTHWSHPLIVYLGAPFRLWYFLLMGALADCSLLEGIACVPLFAPPASHTVFWDF